MRTQWIASLLTLMLVDIVSPRLTGATPDREVLALFTNEYLLLADTLNTGDLATAILPESGISSCLSAYGITAVNRAFPESPMADSVGVNEDGIEYGIPSYRDVILLVVPVPYNPADVAADLRGQPGVVFADPNGYVNFCSPPIYAPDDQFTGGAQWGLWTPNPAGAAIDPDIDAPEMWSYPWSNNFKPIGIIDSGFDDMHDNDLVGRVWYPSDAATDTLAHGWEVACIAGAAMQAGGGMVGVNFRNLLLSGNGPTPKDDVTTKDAILRALLQRPSAINASWVLGRNSTVVRSAFGRATNEGVACIAAMGNVNNTVPDYPAAFGTGIIAVGATNSSMQRWVQSPSVGSAMGPHLDVVAPGEAIVACDGRGGFRTVSGTSFAAPAVTGIASLLIGSNPNLRPDDIENILKRSADDLGDQGRDDVFGWGLVNGGKAMRLISPPNQLIQVPAKTGGQIAGSQSLDPLNTAFVFGIANGSWHAVERYEIRSTIVFADYGLYFTQVPIVWGRGFSSRGYEPFVSGQTMVSGINWCEPVEIYQDRVVMRTYIYSVQTSVSPIQSVWLPCPKEEVKMACTVLIATALPSQTNSFFVPQAGFTPWEGWEAYRYFRACPNNDGAGSLPQQARLKVVLKDGTGAPIPNVRAEDVFILFNKGSAAQGFVGDGADSVIANGVYNTTPLCPNLQAIPANGPTDATGTTYITFTGAGGLPDPARRWGHYDSEIPVYALGVKLQGRVTSGANNGTYYLQIKNFDWTMGLSASENQGEIVSLADLNGVAMGQGVHNTISFWKDFDWNGEVALVDLNMILAHLNHDCCTPLP